MRGRRITLALDYDNAIASDTGTLRDAIPRAAPLARAEFATLRLRLLKIGARLVEKAALFRLLAGRLTAAAP